jgi:hypothetical protein
MKSNNFLINLPKNSKIIVWKKKNKFLKKVFITILNKKFTIVLENNFIIDK